MILLDVCNNPTILSVLRMVNIAILIIKIVVPILLILSLTINYLKATTKNDADALEKANKSTIPKVVAAILIFFIPTFVNLIADNTSFGRENFSNCIANATDEKISELYVAQAQKRVDIARETVERTDYNIAYAEVISLKNETEKQRLLKELEEILKAIEEKEEQEALERAGGIYRQFGNLDNDFWFPVGGSEAIEVGGLQFAPGTPVATRLTAHFGGNDSVHQGLGGGHGAIDIGANRGSYVIAAKSGVVTFPGPHDRIDYPESYIKPDESGKYNCRGLTANRVYIDHGDGTKTGYAHFLANTITVRAGDEVIQGQIIGKVGSSGCSTGPHLHFEVYVNGKKVDPEKYVSGRNPRP